MNLKWLKPLYNLLYDMIYLYRYEIDPNLLPEPDRTSYLKAQAAKEEIEKNNSELVAKAFPLEKGVEKVLNEFEPNPIGRTPSGYETRSIYK